jgi:hypothetical protein
MVKTGDALMMRAARAALLDGWCETFENPHSGIEGKDPANGVQMERLVHSVPHSCRAFVDESKVFLGAVSEN